MRIELTLLSGVAVRGEEVAGPRLRALLALLAGHLRTGCGTSRLVGGIWPDDPPENPAKAVQILVSRVRSRFGAGLIVRDGNGYRLALAESEVDVAAARLYATAAAEHARAGSPVAALAEAEAGLALFPAGQDGIADEQEAGAVAALRAQALPTRLELCRIQALALARLGRAAAALQPLRTVAAELPWDEEIVLELVRAQAEVVSQAAALAGYEDYRRALRDELGTDPGPALQAVHRELLAGAGAPVRDSVPHEPNPLLGRADDVDAVRGLLRQSRVVTVLGTGGLGKTRLAQAVAQQAAQRVVQFVELAGLGPGCDLNAEVASMLRRPGGLAMPVVTGFAELVDALGGGPTLLVLDNCEHLLAEVAELVRALVAAIGELRVLTTSRAPLGLTSEAVYPLPALDAASARRLFAHRAKAARPDVELPDDEVTRICVRLDGLPLAVELAAARVRALSVAEIAVRLDDRFALLRGGPRDAPDRHRTLAAVVDWSWTLLDEPGRAAMRALSVFPGGFTEAAAAALLGVDPLPVLEWLVDSSLLTVVDTRTGTRFRMLETVREFATVRREQAGETAEVRAAFLCWARRFGRDWHDGPLGADPFAAMEVVRAELDNLALALRLGGDEAQDQDAAATVVAVTAVLAGLHTAETDYVRIEPLVDEVAWLVSHFRPGPDDVEVTRMATTLCAAAMYTIEPRKAARFLVALRRLPEVAPDTIARATSVVVRAAPELGEPGQPNWQALANHREPLVAGLMSSLESYHWEGIGEARSGLRAAYHMHRSFELQDNAWLRAVANFRVAELCLLCDEFADAVTHISAAGRLLQEAGAPQELLNPFLLSLALARLGAGEVAQARRSLEDIDADSSQEEYFRTFEFGVRAEVLLAEGDTERGLAYWRRAASIPADIVEPGVASWTLAFQSVAVTAHALAGRTGEIADVTAALTRALAARFDRVSSGDEHVVIGTAEFPMCGAALLAIGAVQVAAGGARVTAGVRLIALAQRFRFFRQFPYTMDSARAALVAEQADGAAYAEAMSAYAALDPAGLRAAGVAALRALSADPQR